MITRNTLKALLRAIEKKGRDLTLEEVYAIDRSSCRLKNVLPEKRHMKKHFYHYDEKDTRYLSLHYLGDAIDEYEDAIGLLNFGELLDELHIPYNTKPLPVRGAFYSTGET